MTGSLTGRLALALGGVAVAATLLAGALTAPLLGSATEEATRRPLGHQAELLARLPVQAVTSTRIDRITGRADLTVGIVRPDGSASGPASALPDAQLDRLIAGRSVSTEAEVDGQRLLVEGRPSARGGAVVVATDAAEVGDATRMLRRRVLLAVGLGLVAALGVAGLLAAGIGRPLARTAAAARELAAGRRGVPLPRSTTREVADVTTALGALDAALVTSEGRQREFLLSVSHELRTPLTAIRGYAEGLADGVVPADEAREVGATMLAEAARLDRYVADLLALARLEADDFALDLRPVDLAELVTSAAAAWEERATRAGLQVLAEAGPAGATTDPVRVRQVLDALVDNAVRVCAPGDVVTLTSTTTPSGARLEVRDTGPGLTAADAAVAFEPGVLHDRYAGLRPGGHGLGLAIVGRLVARLGGTVRVVPGPGRGTAFVIDLP